MLPVARLLLRAGIGFEQFADISKAAFVEVASRDYGLRGRPTNISRVAAMTGIGRKQISRIRRAVNAAAQDVVSEINPLTDVLARWYTDPRYLDETGLPKPLLFQGEQSFTSLVRSCAGDIPAGAIKVELVRSGSVAEGHDGRLAPLRRHVVAAELDERLVEVFVSGLRSLAATCAFNTTGPDDLGLMGRIQRLCISEPLNDQTIEALHLPLREKAEAFLAEIQGALAQADDQRSRTGRRVGFGLYYYEDE